MDYHALQPFKFRRRYRTLRAFDASLGMGDPGTVFEAGEILTYMGDAFSGYDGFRRFDFVDEAGEPRYVFRDIYDEQIQAHFLRERFEEVVDAASAPSENLNRR